MKKGSAQKKLCFFIKRALFSTKQSQNRADNFGTIVHFCSNGSENQNLLITLSKKMPTMNKNIHRSDKGLWLQAMLWIPTLYFASGLPYHTITNLSDYIYKEMGISNADITFYTGILLLPWTLKPFWSPFIEMWRTRRWWIVSTQLLLALCFIAIAFALSTKHFFAATLIFFLIAAFVSATHDIAADGFYILGLSEEKQSFFSGIRNTFYRVAMVFGSGVLVITGGWLARRTDSCAIGWGITMGIVALLMLLFSLYHKFVLPTPKEDIPRKPESIRAIFENFGHIIITYFKKPGIVGALLFLLLFRLPEAQLVKMGKLFLLDSATQGGLGITTEQIGFINGVLGVAGLIAGGIIGGICVSRKGLKYWLWPMVVAISIPDLVYVYMSYAQPTDIFTISSCIFIEQLGYGFGFTAYTLYMIYFAQGEYPTAHFAISTAFMSLGMMLPGILSGKIQQLIGYKHFFIWIMLCCIVTFAVSAIVKIDPEFGKKRNK